MIHRAAKEMVTSYKSLGMRKGHYSVFPKWISATYTRLFQVQKTGDRT